MASKYSNLILFIFLTSLPLFFFMLYYEKLLEETLLELIKILIPPSDYDPMFPARIQGKSITPEFSRRLTFVCFLYLVPLHLLELLSSISTVYLASKMQTDQEPYKFTLREAIRTSWQHKNRLKGVFITSIYIFTLSNCALLGFLWFPIQSYTMSKTLFFDPVFATMYPLTILVLLLKFPELSAIWNMTLVMSVMEGVDGLRAFSLSFYFSKGSERRGLLMMFMFFASSLGLRTPCLFEGEEREVGIVARASLLWILHLVKWVACTWYYFGCKNRVLLKKVDLEVGDKFEVETSKNAP